VKLGRDKRKVDRRTSFVHANLWFAFVHLKMSPEHAVHKGFKLWMSSGFVLDTPSSRPQATTLLPPRHSALQSRRRILVTCFPASSS